MDKYLIKYINYIIMSCMLFFSFLFFVNEYYVLCVLFINSLILLYAFSLDLD